MPEACPITENGSESYRPQMESLAQLFHHQTEELGRFVPIGEPALPPVYQTLLAHRGHMTVTLEAFHGSLVDVHAVSTRGEASWYARQSLLTRQSDAAVVQYGIMRIDTTDLPTKVRSEIESREAPLGRILIRHHLLREVELLALWEIETDEKLARLLGLQPGEVVYGRSAAIHLADHPAVELLEIVTEDPSKIFP